MWVIHEFLLGVKVLVYCGSQSSHWEHLSKLLHACQTVAVSPERYCNLPFGLWGSSGAKVVRAKEDYNAAQSSEKLMVVYDLDVLILQWADWKYQDLRDKGVVEAEYSKTAEEIYCDSVGTVRHTNRGYEETVRFEHAQESMLGGSWVELKEAVRAYEQAMAHARKGVDPDPRGMALDRRPPHMSSMNPGTPQPSLNPTLQNYDSTSRALGRGMRIGIEVWPML
ncbi:uncharacterized protein BDZ99DRAFT_527156 [Mytilinidion resinicola]|uniref:Uncharacterized protein n=1 Tax=Mytilinidion resinicola TaxID=574789 RepID=A0A6A6Y251_9PEZI|nr:uncharacterized protein BDZ99DRAFT_527156 [Mytilinidion resinicola]KAF2802719.1 hypothetical protein BDZ99DRAFT_527156 [Mytilinidion resinicola]